MTEAQRIFNGWNAAGAYQAAQQIAKFQNYDPKTEQTIFAFADGSRLTHDARFGSIELRGNGLVDIARFMRDHGDWPLVRVIANLYAQGFTRDEVNAGYRAYVES